jgi:hypothetical protein
VLRLLVLMALRIWVVGLAGVGWWVSGVMEEVGVVSLWRWEEAPTRG